MQKIALILGLMLSLGAHAFDEGLNPEGPLAVYHCLLQKPHVWDLKQGRIDTVSKDFIEFYVVGGAKRTPVATQFVTNRGGEKYLLSVVVYTNTRKVGTMYTVSVLVQDSTTASVAAQNGNDKVDLNQALNEEVWLGINCARE